MRLCLNYYFSIITNHLEEKNNESLFRKDNMSIFYTTETIQKLTKIWSTEKIKIVLNLTTYLTNNETADTDVKSLETIMDGIDKLVKQVF